MECVGEVIYIRVDSQTALHEHARAHTRTEICNHLWVLPSPLTFPCQTICPITVSVNDAHLPLSDVHVQQCHEHIERYVGELTAIWTGG